MFEIREFVDDNDHIIRSDIVDLSKEMEAMRAILSKQQEKEEERIREDYRKKRRERGERKGLKEEEEEEEERVRTVKEKYEGYLKTFHNQGGGEDEELDEDEDAKFIRELEHLSRMGNGSSVSHVQSSHSLPIGASTSTSELSSKLSELETQTQKTIHLDYSQSQHKALAKSSNGEKVATQSKGFGWTRGFLSGSNNKNRNIDGNMTSRKQTLDIEANAEATQKANI